MEYTSLMYVHHESVKFTFNGKEILQYSTPKSLNMKCDDIILANYNGNNIIDNKDNVSETSDVKLPVLGEDSISTEERMNSSTSKPPVLGTKPVKIKIVGSSSVLKDVNCHLFYDRPFYKIRREYTTLSEVSYKSVKFTFNGKEILKYCTPRSLDMKRGDVIIASLSSPKRKYSEGIKMEAANVNPPVMEDIVEDNISIPSINQTEDTKMDNSLDNVSVLEDMIEAKNYSLKIKKAEDNILDTSNVIPQVLGKGTMSIKIQGSSVIEEVDCKVTKSESLTRIFEEYIRLIGCDADYEFTFNGKTVNQETPEKLGMQNGDVIQYKKTSLVKIMISGPHQKFKEVKYYVASNDSLDEITKQYASYIGIKHKTLKFVFNGSEVDENSTPTGLKMENGNIIEAIKLSDFEITVKVVDTVNSEGVNITVPYRKMFSYSLKAYTKKIGTAHSRVTFIFNGGIIVHGDTPEKLNMKNGDVLQAETKPNIKEEYISSLENKKDIVKQEESSVKETVNHVCTEKEEIDLKLMGTDGNKVTLSVSLVASMQNIRLQYENSIGNIKETTLIYNGSILTDLDTPLSLNMINNDAIQVYTEDEKINIKFSLPSEIPTDINFSLKYGDSLDVIMKEFADRMGINLNSVRFMIGDRRIKSGQSPKQARIIPNDVIQLIDDRNSSNIFPIEAKYGDPFSKIIEDSGRFEDDHWTIRTARSGIPGDFILGHQTPKELEMSNNDSIIVYRTDVQHNNIKSDGKSVCKAEASECQPNPSGSNENDVIVID